MSEAALHLRDVARHYPLTGGVVRRTVGTVRAVDGVTLTVTTGETLGIVGESGCGKSTLARLMVGLEPPTSGDVSVFGVPRSRMDRAARRRATREVQIVMQDPFASLNPRMTVFDIVAEPLVVHPDVVPGGRSARSARVRDLLAMVGLNPDHAGRYPHEFSGGQRQRVSIARALAVRPRVLICDEPVSALDVSIQAQVVNLLQDLQRDLGLACVFIAHNLAVVSHLSTRVAVMYLGKVVELGPVADVCDAPTHPYTFALLAAVPSPDPRQRDRAAPLLLQDDVPSPTRQHPGCPFAPRCWKAQDRCRTEPPPLAPAPTGAALVACHFPQGVPA